MELTKNPTRHLFFTGKGGVGKTSLACATAVRLADAGKRVLLVSTDPASNLDEVLVVKLGPKPTPIATVPRLFAMNLDPEAAAAAYRERMVGPYRKLLPAAAVRSMEEQFSGSCTLEIAAFDEFSHLLGDPAATTAFDHVLFDTAPTGHTLRLLTLPSAWSGFMKTNTTGTSCLGPLAGLQAEQELYRQTVNALANPKLTTLVLVARPETSALREAARTSAELSALHVKNQHLIVNAVFHATDKNDSVAVAMEKRGELALSDLPDALRDLPRTLIPLSRHGLLGIDALRAIGESPPLGIDLANKKAMDLPAGLAALMDGLTVRRHGVILAMGKGGVGKTTVAAGIAIELALLGHQVLLTTTDPAAHVAATIASDVHPNISVSRIDPKAETARYSAEVMQTAGAGLDEQGKALLAEDLRSPCTEEIAVFRAFADAVAAGNDRFVVLDTAPTGHTVLLLDAALAYHREVTRQASKMPDAVEKLLPRLRDPEFSRVLIVTLPEATPVHEAAQLQKDLRRAGIEPYAWIINQCLAPLDLTDPLLLERQQCEQQYIREVVDKHATRTAMIPWQKDPPVGYAGLQKLFREEIQVLQSKDA